MSDSKDSQSLSEKTLDLAEKIFDTIWNTNGSHDIWHWAILTLVVLIAIAASITVISKAFTGIIENLIKLFGAYKSSGLPMWLNDANKSRVRRRKQFCSVLDADLAYLAKAENWNDQYFTDLEAEVETEGGYYASAWHRVRRIKSFGLRKEPSLIRAITSSAERAMQLIGEPGSGKSVALRHLAKQFATQGQRSNDKHATVPLYINLREMESGKTGEITANDVREFVLDNIRRGDADTSAFVRENWIDYCDRGIWLFLFDSFDEIPAVLHSAVGSNVVKQYSQAIRQFLEGMGECKGILASREFKGPEALPWKKLRILPLSGEKQDELIQNSFLTPQQMSLVRQHLANSDNSIGSTPLFLTLLCRYIRDEQKSPNNDHDILLQHIERLARREPEYLERKYKLTAEELIDGAERLAQLFAEDESLSLAPTLDQITTQLSGYRIPGNSIERLISALVDCKIGRADVPNAAHGDRRFAFAHRRYQEALFVRYLARHPESISALELLTQPRWREYTVTLLQTREPEEIQNLLATACAILQDRTASQIAIGSVEPPLPSHLTFFEWSDEVAVPLLALLQEGLARRLLDVPPALSNAIHFFLEPRWLKGDTWDRCEVIRLGGLLPHDILVEYLVESFALGTQSERAQAFKQAAFASVLPEEARSFVLEMLSDQLITAKDRADQLRLEALAARLPTSMGANHVISRGNNIRRHLRWINKINSIIKAVLPLQITDRMLELILGRNFVPNQSSNRQQSIPSATLLFLPLFFLVIFLVACISELIKNPDLMLWLVTTLTIIAILTYSQMFCPFLVRSYGKKVSIYDAIEWTTKHLTSKDAWETVKTFLTIGIGLIAMWPLGYAINFIANSIDVKFITNTPITFWDLVGLGIGTMMTFIYIVGIPLMLRKIYKSRAQLRDRQKRLDALKKSTNTEFTTLCSASNIEELSSWLQLDESLLTHNWSIRGFSSFVLDTTRNIEDLHLIVKPEPPSCLNSERMIHGKLNLVRQILEDRFKATLN